jgi:hypothetical protein
MQGTSTRAPADELFAPRYGLLTPTPLRPRCAVVLDFPLTLLCLEDLAAPSINGVNLFVHAVPVLVFTGGELALFALGALQHCPLLSHKLLAPFL